jgi:hypothetical protein
VGLLPQPADTPRKKNLTTEQTSSVVQQPPTGVNLSDVAAGSPQPRPSSEGRCIPRFQVYRMSAQADRLLVWRSIRCDAPGLNARSNAEVENVSTSFHAPREPQQSTRLGPPHNKSFSRSKDGTFLMRLPSVMRGACAPTAATPLKLTRVGDRGTMSNH